MEVTKYKHAVIIQQVFTTEVVIESFNQELNTHEEIRKALKDNDIKTPEYAMCYYDKNIAKTSVFKDWIKDDEVLMSVSTEAFKTDYKLI